MKKKNILTFCLSFICISTLHLSGASPDWRLHSITSLGIEPTARIKIGEENSDHMKTGFSLKQEILVSIAPTLDCGAGIRYLFQREDSFDQEYTWIPIYMTVRLQLPSRQIPFYLKGAGGYSILKDETGELYYGLGVGTTIPIFYTRNFRYSMDFGIDYSSCNGRTGSDSDTTDIRYTSLGVSAGLGISY